ncbi:MAG: hypothetical protein AAGE52_14415 [Myxococcota bacterium]
MGGTAIGVTLAGPVESPSALWDEFWTEAWKGIEFAIRPFPAASEVLDLYLEDLLPENEYKTKRTWALADGVELSFSFHDFGGALSISSYLVRHWFALGVSLVGPVVAGRHGLVWNGPDAHRLTAPPVLHTRGRLFAIASDLSLESDSGNLDDPTAAERERADRCFAHHESEDPAWRVVQFGLNAIEASRRAMESNLDEPPAVPSPEGVHALLSRGITVFGATYRTAREGERSPDALAPLIALGWAWRSGVLTADATSRELNAVADRSWADASWRLRMATLAPFRGEPQLEAALRRAERNHVYNLAFDPDVVLSPEEARWVLSHHGDELARSVCQQFYEGSGFEDDIVTFATHNFATLEAAARTAEERTLLEEIRATIARSLFVRDYFDDLIFRNPNVLGAAAVARIFLFAETFWACLNEEQGDLDDDDAEPSRSVFLERHARVLDAAHDPRIPRHATLLTHLQDCMQNQMRDAEVDHQPEDIDDRRNEGR